MTVDEPDDQGGNKLTPPAGIDGKDTTDNLRQTEEKFRMIFESVSDAIVVADLSGMITEANRQALTMLGYSSRNGLVGKNGFDFIAPRAHKRAEKNHQQILAQGSVKAIRYPMVRADGSEFHGEVSANALKDASGQPVGVISVARDITTPRKMSRALRDSEEMYRALFRSALDGVCVIDENMKVLLVNRTALEIFGYGSPVDIDSVNAFDYIASDEVRRIATVIAMDMFQNDRRQTNEIRCVNKAGQEIWISAIGQRIRYRGKVAGLCSFRDVTDRKRAEEALRLSEERYRSLVQDTDAGVAAIDLKGKLTFVNRALCQITGYDESRLVGRFFLDFIHPDDRQHLTESLQGATTSDRARFSLEFKVLKENGGVIHVYCSPSAIRQSGNLAGFIAIINDVSLHKQAEDQLVAYEKELRSLASQLSLAEERERRRIATEVHERVTQNLALLRLKLGQMAKQAPSSEITSSLDEAKGVIQDLIKETRSLTFELSPPHLYEIGLEGALEQLTDQMREQYGLPASFEDDNQPKPVDDEVRVLLYQTVRELLVNARKHAKAHQVSLRVKRRGTELQITVEDDGVGFDTTALASGRNPRKGFGLFSVRERLNYIGGYVEMDSERGRGTRITLVAPLKQECTGA